MRKIFSKHITFCLLLHIFAVQISFAQQYTTRLINSTQGLSNNEINDIFQDSRAFIWFATEDGLNRYDGYEYEVFRKDFHDSLSIGSNMIHCIAEDDKQNLWIGTDKGISLLDIKTGAFKNISFSESKIGFWPNETFDLVFDQQGALWCLMSDRIIQYRPERNNFSEFAIPAKYHIDRDRLDGYLTYHQRTGTIYIGTGSGLLYIKENYREVRETTVQDVRIHDIYISENDDLWIASSNGFLRCGEGDNGVYGMSCDYLLEGKAIRGIVRDFDDNLILLSEEKILLVEENAGEIISEVFFNLPGYDTLPLIRSTMVDRTMNLWIGTQKGVCHADLKPQKFEYYNTDSRREVSIHQNVISSICLDDENIYLGSWIGGFETINVRTRESKYYTIEDNKSFYPERNVHAILKDSDGRIWVLGDGMYRFYPENGEFRPVRDELNFPELEQIRDSRISDILEIGKDEFYLSHMEGVYYFKKDSSIFRNDSLIVCDTVSIPLFGVQKIEESDSYFWFAAYAGIWRKHKVTNEINYYPTDVENGLSGRITTIHVDGNDELWGGSSEGLFRFNQDDSSFQAYNVQDGFENDFIYSMEEDGQGGLWMGTNKGIVCFNTEKEEVRNFGIQHGLSAMEFNLGASCKSEDGLMYFGSVEGVNFFDPKNMFFVEDIPQSMICAVKYFNREKQVYDVMPNEKLRINDTEAVQIFFSAMDHTMTSYNEYKYRLLSNGGSGHWNDIGSENSILLSGLEHGNYIFEVRGANSEGIWSKKPASLSIDVNAPFFRRQAFLFIVSVPILVLIFLVFYNRTKTLRKSNRVLREKENVAKEVMQQKNLLSRRNKNIEDSLKYAQRIQYAMFTSAAEIRKMIPQSFVLQKPKDIVSGDFYWARKIGTKVFIAAADCTGHGVPGAFMSLIGIEFFRQIIGGQKIYKPSLILDEINRNFDIIFGNDADIDLRDGMDLAFIAIDTDTNIVQFAGAVNPLYIVRSGEIIEIKGDRIVLGPDLGFGKSHFNNHEVQLEVDDMLYIFSDGYVDQFGGPEGKKFKFRRFRHLLLSIADQPVEVQQLMLDSSMKDWIGNHEQVDDILVMGFRPVVKSTSQEEDLSSEQDHRPEKVY